MVDTFCACNKDAHIKTKNICLTHTQNLGGMRKIIRALKHLYLSVFETSKSLTRGAIVICESCINNFIGNHGEVNCPFLE